MCGERKGGTRGGGEKKKKKKKKKKKEKLGVISKRGMKGDGSGFSGKRGYSSKEKGKDGR